MTDLDLATARSVLDAAVGEAARLGIPMAVAVCDQGGHLLSFARMDECMLLAADTVQAKARTAVYLRRPTAETVERSRSHPTVYTSFVQVSQAPIVMSMGGLPLWNTEGGLVGGVAAAGGTGEEDVLVARAGEQAWLDRRGKSGR